jgi:hypothetical protein
MLPLALMVSVDVRELAVHQSNSEATPSAERSTCTLSKKTTDDRIDSHSTTIRLSTMSFPHDNFFARRITSAKLIKGH